MKSRLREPCDGSVANFGSTLSLTQLSYFNSVSVQYFIVPKAEISSAARATIKINKTMIKISYSPWKRRVAIGVKETWSLLVFITVTLKRRPEGNKSAVMKLVEGRIKLDILAVQTHFSSAHVL